jgi:DNA primase
MTSPTHSLTQLSPPTVIHPPLSSFLLGNAHVKTAETLVAYQMKAAWPETTQDLTSWLKQQPLEKVHLDFQRDGFIKVVD